MATGAPAAMLVTQSQLPHASAAAARSRGRTSYSVTSGTMRGRAPLPCFSRLGRLTSDPRYARHAAALAHVMRDEDGVAGVVAAVEVGQRRAAQVLGAEGGREAG